MKTLEGVNTVAVGQRPRGIVLSPDFSRLYICTSDGDRVEMWDPVALTKIGELPSELDPEQFALSPDGRQLYIANEDDDIVAIVDTETRMARSRSTPPRRPTWYTGSTPKPFS